MIRHIVLFKFKSDTGKEEIEEIFSDLVSLQGKVPGIIAFKGGPYTSPEGLNQGFTHGFTMDFADAAARDIYLPHPEHEKVKVKIIKALEGGAGGVIAFDYEINPSTEK